MQARNTIPAVTRRALFRIWPLLLTIPLYQGSLHNSSQRIAWLGLSSVAVAISLLFYLMTADQMRGQSRWSEGAGSISNRVTRRKQRRTGRWLDWMALQSWLKRISGLMLVLVGEALALIGFAELPPLLPFIDFMFSMSLFCLVSYGLVYSILPVLRLKAIGSVMGGSRRWRQCRDCLDDNSLCRSFSLVDSLLEFGPHDLHRCLLCFAQA